MKNQKHFQILDDIRGALIVAEYIRSSNCLSILFTQIRIPLSSLLILSVSWSCFGFLRIFYPNLTMFVAFLKRTKTKISFSCNLVFFKSTPILRKTMVIFLPQKIDSELILSCHFLLLQCITLQNNTTQQTILLIQVLVVKTFRNQGSSRRKK